MIKLTLACAATDRTRPLMDGRVTVPGCDITFLPGEPEDIFRRALRDRAFDISELSMGSHIVTTARGDSPYVGIPVFLSRAFRHSAIYVRTDRGIAPRPTSPGAPSACRNTSRPRRSGCAASCASTTASIRAASPGAPAASGWRSPCRRASTCSRSAATWRRRWRVARSTR